MVVVWSTQIQPDIYSTHLHNLQQDRELASFTLDLLVHIVHTNAWNVSRLRPSFAKIRC